MTEREVLDRSKKIAKGAAVSLGKTYLKGKCASELLNFYTRSGAFDKLVDTPEFQKLAYAPVEPIQVNGIGVREVGVVHIPPVFAAHEDDFRREIQQSKIVILEYFRDGIPQDATPKTTTEDLLAKNKKYTEYAKAFFSGLGRLCAEEGKDIIEVNPQSKPNIYLDFYLCHGLPRLVKSFGDAKENKNQRTLNRWTRGFSTLVQLSWTRALPTGRRALENAGILSPDDNLPDNARANLVGYSVHDYRDIRTAEGIEFAVDRYKDELKQGDQILVIHGAMHNGVVEYLQQPKKRKLKRLVYPLHHALGDKTLRRYSYDQAAGSWSQTEKVPY